MNFYGVVFAKDNPLREVKPFIFIFSLLTSTLRNLRGARASFVSLIGEKTMTKLL